jgi:alpha-tubulin suppressor-like RCC1 family protein
MSPEQLRFREPDRRSDLFSLGVVLYELLAGRRLYREEETNAAAVRILEEPAPDIGEVRNDVTPELTGLMFELLAKDPAMRPSDAQQVAQRLEAMLSAFEAEAGPFDLSGYVSGEFGERRAQMAQAIAAAEQQMPAHPVPETRVAPVSRRRQSVVVAVAMVAAAAIGIAVIAAPWRGQERSAGVGGVVPLPAGGGLWMGNWHSCATRGRELHCWGKNNEGQLGDGGTINLVISRKVSGVTDIVSMAGGAFHSVAVRRDGVVFGWGRNEDGQLGGIGVPRTLTALPIPGTSDARAVAAGDKHTCVLRGGGRVTCFGSRSDAAGTLDAKPTADVPGLADAVEIAAGGDTTCARRHTGHVACFGRNDRGQLGDGSTTASDVPVGVIGITDASQIALGSRFACAVRAGGEVMCWGDNDDGQLGVPSSLALRAVAATVPGLRDIVQVSLLTSSACALRRGGEVMCWGRGDWGNLGDGTASSNGSRPDPRPVLGLSDAAFLAAGSVHICARRTTGEIVCWGDNANGQLGEGTLEQRTRPVSVAVPN